MGRRGPPKTPKAIKDLRGTSRKDRDTDDSERGLEYEVPEPPENLSGKALEAWERIGPKLAEAKLLTGLDSLAFEVLCRSYAGVIETAERLDDESLVMFVGENGTPMANPLVGINAKNLATLKWTLTQFGLTPAARNAIKIMEKKDELDDMDKLLNG